MVAAGNKTGVTAEAAELVYGHRADGGPYLRPSHQGFRCAVLSRGSRTTKQGTRCVPGYPEWKNCVL